MSNRKVSLFVGFVCLLMLPFAAKAELSARRMEIDISSNRIASTLPLSLNKIEESAFYGTAMEHLILPEGLEEIRDSAFAGMRDLMFLYIPSSAQSIGSNILTDSGNAAIIGSENSEAQRTASLYHIPFTRAIMLTRVREQRAVPGVIPARAEIAPAENDQYQIAVCEARAQRTGRPENELKLSRFQGRASEYVQSRYFP